MFVGIAVALLSGGVADRAMAQIAAGLNFNLAQRTNGTVRVWGSNEMGQFGNGDDSGTASSNVPVVMPPFGTAQSGPPIAFFAGSGNGCAIMQITGEVWCWGSNTAGQLGDGTPPGLNAFRPDPGPVTGLTGITQVAIGDGHICALSGAGAVHCWGQNHRGQLGDGSLINRSTPVALRGLRRPITAIAAGGSHSCAIINNGRVYCWGRNVEGQLGNGNSGFDHSNNPVPGRVVNSGLAAQITAGDGHTCILNQGVSRVRCWGRNASGELGNGTTDNSPVPVRVRGVGRNAVSLHTGLRHNCVLLARGGTRCWGSNLAGQLGIGVTGGFRATPVIPSPPARRITALALGSGHTCWLRDNGRIFCAGQNNFGQIGDGTNISRDQPVRVRGAGFGSPS